MMLMMQGHHGDERLYDVTDNHSLN